MTMPIPYKIKACRLNVIPGAPTCTSLPIPHLLSDFPHHERFGYGGDALGAGEAALPLYDWFTFLRKQELLDYNDAQRSSNGFTETAPFVGIADKGLGW